MDTSKWKSVLVPVEVYRDIKKIAFEEDRLQEARDLGVLD